MTELDMLQLLEIYDAQEKLHEIVVMLIDEDRAPGYGEGIVGSLSCVTEIIKRHSPLYHPGEDFEYSAFWRLLEDRSVSNKKKAHLLING